MGCSAGAAQQLFDGGVGKDFARGLQAHDGLARAKTQTIAGAKFYPFRFRPRQGGERIPQRRKQRLTAAFRIAAWPDADQQPNRESQRIGIKHG